jgi:agmatine deiminase
MISDFETNTIYFSEYLKTDKKFNVTHSQLVEVLNELGLNPKYLKGTNDIWARDYMPIQLDENKYIEYRYDPDYLQGNSDQKHKREFKTYPDIVCDIHQIKTIKSNIILDGGNMVKSKNCIILTDKIIWENKQHFTTKQLLSKLHTTFEVEKVVIIPWDNDCIYGHTDGMLRFIDNDTVLISGFYEQQDVEIKNTIIKRLEEAKLDYDWLRCSDIEEEENISYINFLLTKDILIIPKLNRNEDDIAFHEISKFFPEYKKKNGIKSVNAESLAKMGGALNCISWTTME